MKKITTIFLLFFVAIVFGQRKYTADLYFKEFAYAKSAELYKKIYQKGDSTKLILERLGDSYYFNDNTEESEVWYQKLFENHLKDSISVAYYFRYAQSLKGNGNYQKSDEWILKLKKLNKNDSRVKSLENNTNYLSQYQNKKTKFINIHNLSVNSKYSDYGAYFNDSIIVFSSTRPKINSPRAKIYQWNKQPFYNIYSTKLITFKNDIDIQFIDGNISNKLKNINSPYHDASAVITKDGKTMFFTRNNFDGKKLNNDKRRISHLKIFKAERVNNEWINIKELPFNDEEYSVGHPALSFDESTLYFSSDMPGGFGKTDIYKVTIKSDDNYGEPVNLGSNINTEGKEMFPFVDEDSTLYFASNGHIGLGGLDVFKSKILETSYGKVENLGEPINSEKDDFSFSLNNVRRIGFFSSNRSGGKGDDDVYSFVIRKKEVICDQLVQGVVTDLFTSKVLPGSKVILFENNVKNDSLIVGDDAKYQFKIKCNTAYKVQASKLFYKINFKTFVAPNTSGKVIQDLGLNLKDDFEYSNGQIVVKINPIYFNYNKSNIRTDASLELDKVIAIMQKYPSLIIRSGSHTDARGRAIYNEALSDRRAKSTVKYILSKGINPARISGKGFGESELVNNCVDNDAHTNRVKCTKEEHQLNRRTEFVVINSNTVSAIKTIINKKEKPALHKVVNGDTLFSIARKYNVSVDAVKKLNSLKGSDIFVGQLLRLK
jgi:outer membrane protein OmpA-like peptidoglycan-associated protein/tetratricopeptide (TPR) repeat protein